MQYDYILAYKNGEPIGIAQAGSYRTWRKMIFYFVRQPVYKKRLDFFGVSRSIIRNMLPINIRKGLAYQLGRR